MLTPSELQARLIPFSSLGYSTEAFIDYRIPDCGPKKNYALIGPGVSQNPNQPVSLREKHGFQVGGVAMPPGTVNPPHMHFTPEVFICTRGDWDLHWGFNPDPLKARLSSGDIASVPTWIYRGFQNVGDEEGFMFTALGGDDTGGILWGAQTLEAARAQGVHLTEDYQIIDEQMGQVWDDTQFRRLQPMTDAEMSALRSWSPAQMAQRVVRFDALDWSDTALLDAANPGCGGQLAPVIGLGMSECRDHLAPIANGHGFSIEWLKLPPGGSVSRHRLGSQQVVVCKIGHVQLTVESQNMALTGANQGWDTYAMPADVWRSYQNIGEDVAVLLLMSTGDGRKRIEWDSIVVHTAAEHGLAIDANGCVALKKFTDRSQR